MPLLPAKGFYPTQCAARDAAESYTQATPRQAKTVCSAVGGNPISPPAPWFWRKVCLPPQSPVSAAPSWSCELSGLESLSKMAVPAQSHQACQAESKDLMPCKNHCVLRCLSQRDSVSLVLLPGHTMLWQRCALVSVQRAQYTGIWWACMRIMSLRIGNFSVLCRANSMLCSQLLAGMHIACDMIGIELSTRTRTDIFGSCN